MRRLSPLLAILALGCGSVGAEEGQSAPDFIVERLEPGDPTVSLSSLKGKVVVLDFWATWCGPCKASMPHLSDLYREKKAQGLEVLAVSDEPKDDIARFAARNVFSFSLARDAYGTVSNKYQVSGLPTTVVIGRDGKIVGRTTGVSPEEIEGYVSKALAQK